MLDLKQLQDQLLSCQQPDWAEKLPALVEQRLQQNRNSRLPEWAATLAALKEFTSTDNNLSIDTIQLGAPQTLSGAQQQLLKQTLQQLHPWRKGPFNILGVEVDTEWRSDWKWQRLEQALGPLDGLHALDVGCGSGYHVLRMLGAGASSVVGIEPTLLYVAQFLALNHFAGQSNACVLPFTLEDLGKEVEPFDLVFSMGVLYHRRSPIDHLIKLRQLTRPGGKVVLETLVVEDQQLLVPEGRYAQMRNVWFIPHPDLLMTWLTRSGFTECEVVDITATTIGEQRSTDWMTFDSLQQFLDPHDQGKTIEGHPAPVRAVITAVAN